MISVTGAAFTAGVLAQTKYNVRSRLRAALGGAEYTEVVHDSRTATRLAYNGDAKQVECPTRKTTAVILIVGQSNAANYVTGKHRAGKGAVSFFDGKCYEAHDPLVGATGDRGSIWSLLADKILAAKRFESVVLAPVAVSETTIEMWAPGGTLNPIVRQRISDLRSRNLMPTHIIVQIGETDAVRRTPPAQYRESAMSLIRELQKLGAPIFFAITSGCGDTMVNEIRSAQRRVISDSGQLEGVDMDNLGSDVRANLCHLSSAGAERAAEQWAKIFNS